MVAGDLAKNSTRIRWLSTTYGVGFWWTLSLPSPWTLALIVYASLELPESSKKLPLKKGSVGVTSFSSLFFFFGLQVQVSSRQLTWKCNKKPLSKRKVVFPCYSVAGYPGTEHSSHLLNSYASRGFKGPLRQDPKWAARPFFFYPVPFAAGCPRAKPGRLGAASAPS